MAACRLMVGEPHGGYAILPPKEVPCACLAATRRNGFVEAGSTKCVLAISQNSLSSRFPVADRPPLGDTTALPAHWEHALMG